jgi:hypothetical protein
MSPELALRDISLGCRIGSLSEESGHGPNLLPAQLGRE